MTDYTNNVYSNAVTTSLQDLYAQLINFLPKFLIAVILLIVGWIIAMLLAKIIKEALHAAKLDQLGDKLGLDELSHRTGMKMTVAGTVAWVFKWFVLLVVFLAATEILGLPQVSAFFYNVLAYIPNVIAAAAIMIIGTLAAQFFSRLVRHSVAAAGLHSADLLGAIVQWSIMIFAILATLSQLKIAPEFVSTLFTGVIAMLSIAGGLAFGLGGKEHATRVLDKIEKDIKS